MSGVLIDSSVLIDLTQPGRSTFSWSLAAVREAMLDGGACINPLIYAEVAPGFATPGRLDAAMPPDGIRREPLPYAAAFPAMQAYRTYRERGGVKLTCLPDFFIGAHAQVAGHALLTRDAKRFRTYFPSVRLITPDEG